MTYRFGPFRVDSQREELWREDNPVPLNRKAVRVLLTLMERPGEVVTREQLLTAVWPKRGATLNNLSQHVFMLRSALGEGANTPRYVLTVPSVGYRFVAPLQRGEVESGQRVLARHFSENARDFLERRTPAAISRAIELYERALEHDPRSADALAGLALCRFLLAEYLYESPREMLQLAERDALRTIEVDSKNALALVVLARAAMQLRYHWAEAETLLLDAFRARPDFLWAHVYLVEHYAARGRIAHARQALAQAQSIGVRDDAFPRLPLLAGALEYFDRSFDASHAHLSALVRDFPRFAHAHFMLAKTLVMQGRLDEAVTHLEEIGRIEVDPLSPGQPDVRRRALSLLVYVHALRGDAAGMRAAGAALDDAASALPQSWFGAAVVSLSYGRHAQALRAMERSVQNSESMACFSAVEPLLDPLRELPGWRAIAGAMNLATS